MENFDEYLRQGEPNQVEKAKAWKIAIGLQQVDGLVPSDYLIETAKKNIEGDITIKEVQERIESYYQQQPQQTHHERTEEADKVSTRIAEILGELTFTFSPTEYLHIHKRLFQGIYDFAGKYREYNITKKEWVLDGDTVLYASAEILKETLEYDFEQEKKFNFKGLSKTEIVEHIARFIASLWQIHVFGEGNTRTTALFLIKYLRKLGFKEVNNELFEKHSLYFRNALVRANYENLSNGIYKTDSYILQFLANLLLNEQHELKNRTLHIHFSQQAKDSLKSKNDTVNLQDDTVNDTVFIAIKENEKITVSQLASSLNRSPSTIKRKIKALKEQGLIERIGSDKTGHWKIIS